MTFQWLMQACFSEHHQPPVNLLVGKPSGRQRPKRWGVKRVEGAAPAAGQLLEGPLVEVCEQLGDRPVELGQAEEAAVAQARQDPALNQQYRAFYFPD